MDSLTHQTRSDLAFDLASQIGKEKSSGDVRRLLKMVGRSKENHLGVRMERLRREVEIVTYTEI